MISLDINTQDLSAEFDLGRSEVDDLLETSVVAITKKFAEQWDNEAKKSLGSTRALYRSAIEIGGRGRFTGIVYLNPAAKIPNMVEMGAPSYDMKTGLLSSPKVKHGKNGDPYISVPFRFATPDAIGESEGFAGKLPDSVFKEVQKSPSTPLGLGSIGTRHRMPKSQALRSKMKDMKSKVGKLPTSQQTSKYEGVKRNSKGSGYVNFRRVSLRSDSAAFMHPGFVARNLAIQALDKFESQIPRMLEIAIDNFLSNL